MKKNNQNLAKKIATALFNSAWDGMAARLQRKLPPQDDWDGKMNYKIALERDGGGWCFDAAVSEIKKILDNA